MTPSPSPEELNQLLDVGLGINDLANMFGVSRYTVRRWVVRAGLKDRLTRGPRPLRIPHNLEIVLKRTGSVRGCARDFGVHANTVLRWIRQKGISREQLSADRPAFDAQFPGARDRLLNGEPFVTVARDLNVNAAKLRKAAVAEGVLSTLDLIRRVREANLPPPVLPPTIHRADASAARAPKLPTAVSRECGPPQLPAGVSCESGSPQLPAESRTRTRRAPRQYEPKP